MSKKTRTLSFGAACAGCPLHERRTTAKTAGRGASTCTRACCAPPALSRSHAQPSPHDTTRLPHINTPAKI